jgi:hypothetical protein
MQLKIGCKVLGVIFSHLHFGQIFDPKQQTNVHLTFFLLNYVFLFYKDMKTYFITLYLTIQILVRKFRPKRLISGLARCSHEMLTNALGRIPQLEIWIL